MTILCYLPQFTKAAVEQDLARVRRKLHPRRVVFAGPVEFTLDGVEIIVFEAVKPKGHYWIEGEQNAKS